jgi:cytochrome c oxidase assembly protein subunit 11
MPVPVKQQSDIRKTVAKTVLALAGMVLFTIALIPLYDVFCEVTGLNGRSAGLSQAASTSKTTLQSTSQAMTDESIRRIQFVTQTGAGLPVRFQSLESQQGIAPGGKQQVMFRFQNLSDKPVVVKAVPSVSPAQASRHLLKIECFCFQALTLAAKETQDIPVVYFLSASFPDEISSLTLAYNLFAASADDLTAAQLLVRSATER